MSQYTKSTNFATKDNLSPGDPLKIVRGTEIDTEFNNISTAISTKTDNSAAAITGGSITGITDLAIADGGTGASTATAALNNLLPSQTGNSSKYLQTDGTNATWDAISINTGDITGTLPVANGGTGITSFGTGIATFLGTPSSANLASAVTDETGSGALVFANTPTLVSPILGTPTSGNFSSGSFTWPTFNQNTTGTAAGLSATLAIASGGTGQTTANAAFNALAPSQTSASGKYLKSDGTNTSWDALDISTADITGTLPVANGGTGVTSSTGTGSVVLSNSPTLVTPILGTPQSGNFSTGTFTWPTFNQNTTGTAAGLSATLATTSGGTGLTSFTSGGVVYASSTSALATGSALTFNGNALGVTGTGGASAINLTDATSHVGFTATPATGGGFYFSNNRVGSSTFFRTSNASGSDTIPMTFLSGGNVGIGTSSPAYKLDVSGTMGVSGAVTLSGGTANAVAYLNGSKVLTSGSTLYFDGTNLALGTTSASGKLHIFKSSGGQLQIQSDNTGTSTIDMGGTTTPARGGIRFDDNDGSLNFRTNSTTQVTLNNAGNLGLGVTPSAWGGSYKALQTPAGSISAFSTSQFGINQNAYDSGTGTFVYATTAAASRYLQLSGAHNWYTAASGTAGNAITFTQAMTLDANQTLLLGATAANLESAYSVALCGSSSAGNAGQHTFNGQNGNTVMRINQAFADTNARGAIYFYRSGTQVGSITVSSTVTAYNTTSDQRLKENIQNADSASSLIDAIQVRKFDWKESNLHERYGFVAQELLTVVPEAVHQPEDTDAMMSVDYSKLVPMLVKEIQSLRVRVAQLETN